jgi:hypothetical protein
MEFAGTLGVDVGSLLVSQQTTDHYFHHRLPVRMLREVAIMAGDDDEGSLRLNRVTKPQGRDGFAA